MTGDGVPQCLLHGGHQAVDCMHLEATDPVMAPDISAVREGAGGGAPAAILLSACVLAHQCVHAWDEVGSILGAAPTSLHTHCARMGGYMGNRLAAHC